MAYARFCLNLSQNPHFSATYPKFYLISLTVADYINVGLVGFRSQTPALENVYMLYMM